MSRRSLTFVAFATAAILTAVGLQQVMNYKQPPPHKLALWFPTLVLVPLPDYTLQLLLTLLQFPLFAAAFALGIRRWKATDVAVVVVLGYALCVSAAFVIL